MEIRNADNIVLSGIEITNKGEGATLRRGVFVNEVDFGVASNVVLRDLYIHDVTGTNARKDNGGIVFFALGPNAPTRFEGVTIERNIVWRVDRSGIAGISDQVTVARWFPSRFVVIRDNVLEDIGLDAHRLLKALGFTASGHLRLKWLSNSKRVKGENGRACCVRQF